MQWVERGREGRKRSGSTQQQQQHSKGRVGGKLVKKQRQIRGRPIWFATIFVFRNITTRSPSKTWAQVCERGLSLDGHCLNWVFEDAQIQIDNTYPPRGGNNVELREHRADQEESVRQQEAPAQQVSHTYAVARTGVISQSNICLIRWCQWFCFTPHPQDLKDGVLISCVSARPTQQQ